MPSLFKTLVRSHVEYCVSASNPHYIKDRMLFKLYPPGCLPRFWLFWHFKNWISPHWTQTTTR